MSDFTSREIRRQPETWRKLAAVAAENAARLQAFTAPFWAGSGKILLAGAGSSEFIGRALAPCLNHLGKCATDVCGTTDLVVCPESYLSAGVSTLLVSFARSGDSPESLGAIDAAEAVNSHLRQLIITCNRQGRLSVRGAQNSGYFVIDLPDETNDQGFAMTNSFTSMYLMALLCLLPECFDDNKLAVEDIAGAGQRFLAGGANAVLNWAGAFDYNRVVYLGTEALKGIAQESGLKMLELTRGQVAVLHDSPLGFRHGPKSCVNDETLVVLYLSDDSFSRKFELDLLREMSRERQGNKLLVVCGQPCAEAQELADCYYCFGNEHSHENGLLAPEFVLTAQMLAYNKSLALQIDPDNPNPAGVVNRVVKGVTVYPYPG